MARKKKTASGKGGSVKNNKAKKVNYQSAHKGAGNNWFTRFQETDNTIPLSDYASVTPAFMMIAMIALILILDLFTTTMADTQFYDFHNVFRAFDYISIVVGLSFLIYKGVKKELSFCLRDAFFGGFIVCIIVSTCINGVSHESAFGLPIRYVGIFNTFAFIIVYMKVSGYISRVPFRYAVLLGYLFVADAVALSALFDRYITAIPAYQGKDGMSALFAQFNHYGYFICMAVMIGIGCFVYEEGWKSVAGVLSAVLNLVVLVLNDTLGAELSVGICIIVMTIVVVICDRNESKRLKKTVSMVAVFLLGVAAALIVSSSLRESVFTLASDAVKILTGKTTGGEGTNRWLIWNTVIGYISEKPLFGFGCEGITVRIQEAIGHGDAHCELLTYAAYYGIPAMILYACGVIAAGVVYFRNRVNLPSYCRIAFLAAGAYFLSSLFGVVMFYTVPFFFIFMGMSVEEYKTVN